MNIHTSTDIAGLSGITRVYEGCRAIQIGLVRAARTRSATAQIHLIGHNRGAASVSSGQAAMSAGMSAMLFAVL